MGGCLSAGRWAGAVGGLLAAAGLAALGELFASVLRLCGGHFPFRPRPLMALLVFFPIGGASFSR